MKKMACFSVFLTLFLALSYSQTPGSGESVLHIIRRKGYGDTIISPRISIYVDEVRRCDIGTQFERVIIPNGSHQVYADSSVMRKSKLLNITANNEEIVLYVSMGILSADIQIGDRQALAGSASPPAAAGNPPPIAAPAPSGRQGGGDIGSLEPALNTASKEIMSILPDNSTIAIINISSQNSEMAEFVIEELTYIFVSSRSYKVVDRLSLDAIRREQNFQLSGEVDDNSAVDIGKMLGANIVITGSIGGADSLRRLRLKALNVTTAEIVTMSSVRF
jgi:hypothetical protein